MTLAETMQATADRLIQKFGNTATFKDVVTQPYTPSTGEAVVTTTDVSIVVAGPIGMNPKLVDGDMIQAGDAMVTVASKDVTFTPEVTERLVILGDTWTIVSVQPMTAQDVVIAWRLQVRR